MTYRYEIEPFKEKALAAEVAAVTHKV